MQKLVVDRSVAIKWFVPEVQSAEARRILGTTHLSTEEAST